MNSRESFAVSNAGPLIHLAKASSLDLLRQLYMEIVVPREVKVEVVDMGKSSGFADAVLVEKAIKERWIRVEEVRVPKALLGLASTAGLAKAEAAVIYYAYRVQAMALLDDEAARVFARDLGVEVGGSLGVILNALRRALIDGTEALAALESLSGVMYLSVDTYKLARSEIERAGGTE